MTKTQLEKLKAAKEALAGALAASTSGPKALAKLEGDRAAILGEIERLEEKATRNPSDEASITRLQLLRDQRTRFDSKIASVQNGQARDGDGHQRDLGEATHAAGELVIQSARPLLDHLIANATQAFTPYYRDENRLRLTVDRCDAVMSLKAFLANAGAGSVPVNGKPQRILTILDGLISGEPLPWKWQGLPPEAPTPAAPVLA
jgi:hypothetical protein